MLSIFSYIVYALCLGLLVFMPVCAKRGQFNEDCFSADSFKGVKGFAAIGVLLHHISQDPAFAELKVLGFFNAIGFIFVGIFFFCSGYGLYKSYRVKKGYLDGFFAKRMLPILVAIYVMNILYVPFNIAMGYEKNALQWVLGVLGLILLNDQGWFPIVIFIMYGAFLFAFKKFKKEAGALLFVLLVALVQVAVFLVGGHFAWWIGYGWFQGPQSFGTCAWYQRIMAFWFQGEWWVNSTLMFVMGLYWAMKEDRILSFFKVNYWLKFAILLVLAAVFTTLGQLALVKVGYWTEFAGRGVGHLDKLITFIAQQLELFFLFAVIFVLRMKFFSRNRVLNFFSSVSLEFYLMQRIAINTMFFLTTTGADHRTPVFKAHYWNIYAYFFAVVALDLVLTFVFKFINKKVLGLLRK